MSRVKNMKGYHYKHSQETVIQTVDGEEILEVYLTNFTGHCYNSLHSANIFFEVFTKPGSLHSTLEKQLHAYTWDGMFLDDPDVRVKAM